MLVIQAISQICLHASEELPHTSNPKQHPTHDHNRRRSRRLPRIRSPRTNRSTHTPTRSRRSNTNRPRLNFQFPTTTFLVYVTPYFVAASLALLEYSVIGLRLTVVAHEV